MEKTEVPMAELYRWSFWLRFLFDGLGRLVKVPGACLLWAVAQTLLFTGLCWWQGTLLIKHTPGELNLLEDTTALACFLVLPLCFLLLYYSLQRLPHYIKDLEGVLEPSRPSEVHEELVAQLRGSFTPEGMRRVRGIFFAAGFLICAYNCITNLFPTFFYGSPTKWDGIAFPVGYATARVYVFFIWGYVVPTWAAEVYMQFHVMARLNQAMADRGWLRVRPLDQDRFGGLKSLAVAASWAGYLIPAAGLFFLAPGLRWAIWDRPLHPGNYVGFGLYLLSAFAGFSLPVYLLHRILSKKRADMLTFLTGAFDELNARVEKLVKENDRDGLGDEKLARSVETVTHLHVQWSALPIWPVTMSFLLKFLATVVVPAVGYWAVLQFLGRLAA